MFFRNSVLILLDEAFRVVADVESVMTDGETCFPETGLFVESLMLGGGKILIEFVHPSLIRSREQTTFLSSQENTFGVYLVKKRQNTELSLNQINTRLIVKELDERPIDLLPHILLLFQFKNMLVELIVSGMTVDIPLAATFH